MAINAPTAPSNAAPMSTATTVTPAGTFTSAGW